MAYINNSLKFSGISSDVLREDLLDHICTDIENNSNNNFGDAYTQAITKFGGNYNLKQLQRLDFIEANSKQIINRQKVIIY
jgi:hypothetical protein